MHTILHKKFVLIFASFVGAIILFSPFATQAACGFHNVTGYVLSVNTDWVLLSCKNGEDVDFGLDIDFSSGSPSEPVTGYAWSGYAGWLDMQPSGPYPVWGSVPAEPATFHRNEGASATSSAGTITGWAKWVALGDDGWVVMGPIDIGGTDYGVGIGADRLFTGWSWNGGDNLDADPQPEQGDGWIVWDSVQSGGGASVLAWWFESLYGDIYSGGNISAPFAPQVNRYNATYLIQANGTITPVVIQSQGGAVSPYIENSFDSLQIPDEANNYRGTLSWLDKAGLIAGRYGTPESALPAASSYVLDGKVYYYTGNLTIGSDITFNKGTGTQKGSGTIVVEGDLIINSDITYQSGSVGSRIDNLPSVAWIVKGDIIIDDTVENLAGVFFSEGSIGTGTKGASFQENEVALTISGMLIANQINLQRLFSDSSGNPAEQIIFDGRSIINPPPGLADISKGLPIIRETRP
jgi:hypothetical protein